jgi:hypothetical protein
VPRAVGAFLSAAEVHNLQVVGRQRKFGVPQQQRAEAVRHVGRLEMSAVNEISSLSPRRAKQVLLRLHNTVSANHDDVRKRKLLRPENILMIDRAFNNMHRRADVRELENEADRPRAVFRSELSSEEAATRQQRVVERLWVEQGARKMAGGVNSLVRDVRVPTLLRSRRGQGAVLGNGGPAAPRLAPIDGSRILKGFLNRPDGRDAQAVLLHGQLEAGARQDVGYRNGSQPLHVDLSVRHERADMVSELGRRREVGGVKRRRVRAVQAGGARAIAVGRASSAFADTKGKHFAAR